MKTGIVTESITELNIAAKGTGTITVKPVTTKTRQVVIARNMGAKTRTSGHIERASSVGMTKAIVASEVIPVGVIPAAGSHSPCHFSVSKRSRIILVV